MKPTIDPARLLEALQKIADIPLYGEPLPASMTDIKAELIEGCEYDEENDMYTPCVDTESSHLQYAVELARTAIAAGDGS